MLYSILFGLVAAKAVIASPIAEPVAQPVAEPRVDHTPLEGSDYHVVWNVNGVDKVFKYSHWAEHLVSKGILLEPPKNDHEFLNFTADINIHIDVGAGPLEKRQACANTQSTVITNTATFVDWDVQMSSVGCGLQDISVQSGWSVSNSLSVSGGIDANAVTNWLSGNVGVNYGRTWESSAQQQNKFTVNDGFCGVMILKPLTTRRYGHVNQGCIGSMKQIGTFIADDRFQGGFNGVSWIGGATGHCQKPGTNPPLSRCQGGGNFI